jgi:CBS domain-containing protein
MNVSDVMTKAPVTVHSDAYLQEAAGLMVQHRVSGLPVVDDAGTLVGLITEGDLIRRAELGTAGAQPGRLSMFLNPGRAAQQYVHTHGRKVGEIMTREVITTSPDTPLAEVVDIMESQQVKRLPVLRNHRLVGIVSRADLLRALAQLLPDRKFPAISDTELRKRLLGEIEKQRWAPRTTIDATVENGIVELRGAVTDDRERLGLRVIAENTPGVRGVHDRLIWVEPISGTVVDAPEQ